ncbi:tetratricopeptide repeat protein [Leptospira sp. 201903071]|uniref:TPR repeat-containing protein BatC n=1 Tax=Leptospira ainazelensis TaxID=2810034 RepID=UPI00196548E4|nr:tetratricopeptide repeat protein [Leptospira ainazelensis]
MKRIRILEYSAIMYFLVFSASASAVELDPGGNRIGEGLEHYNQGEYLDSLRKYQEAETYFPEDPRLEFNRGAAEFKSGNLDKAIRHFEKSANSSSPELQWRSRFNLGNSYMRAGDRKKAAEEYIKALKLNPDLKEARKNLEYLRQNPPPKNSPNSTPNSSNQNPKNSPSQKGNQPQNRNDPSSNGDVIGESPRDQKGKLTEEEAKRILDSLDLNQIRRKSRKSRDREVFW